MIEKNDVPLTVYQLIQQSAERFGDATALTYLQAISPEFVDETISFSALLGNINRVVRLLRDSLDNSTEEHPVVSFLLPNIPQAHYILWGAETAGIANPLNPLLNEDALVGLMSKAKTDILIALGPNPVSDIWEKAQAVADRLPKKPKLISVAFPASDDSPLFDALLPEYSDEPLPVQWLPAADDIAAYFHTGGTTSTPKLALQTHTNQLSTADAYVRSMNSTAGEVGVNGMPLFHVAGALVIGLGSLAAGVNSVLPTMAGFRNPQVIARHWDIVERYHVSISGGIPTSLAAMVEVPIGEADISTLRLMLTGGAPMSLSVADDITKLTGRPLHQMYGMTEAAGSITMPNLSCAPLPGSAGHIRDDVEIRIDTDSADARGVGEICVRGPMVFPGYLGSDTSPLDDGWLRTGDLGYIDANNNLFITGRAKDLIIRSGHNIDPAMIEASLESHPAVSMAAAVGKPDAYAGELPVVYVQLHPEHTVDEAELRDYAMAHIDERPACPKEVFILEALPITAVGKIHKPTLRAKAAARVVRDALAEFEVEVKAIVLNSGGLQVEVCSADSNKQLAAVCGELAGRLSLNIVVVARLAA